MVRSMDPKIARDTPPVAALPDRACAGENPAIFFPENNETPREALGLCRRCPHRVACLDWAVKTRQSFGVWGGTTAAERDRMIRGAA